MESPSLTCGCVISRISLLATYREELTMIAGVGWKSLDWICRDDWRDLVLRRRFRANIFSARRFWRLYVFSNCSFGKARGAESRAGATSSRGASKLRSSHCSRSRISDEADKPRRGVFVLSASWRWRCCAAVVHL